MCVIIMTNSTSTQSVVQPLRKQTKKDSNSYQGALRLLAHCMEKKRGRLSPPEILGSLASRKDPTSNNGHC